MSNQPRVAKVLAALLVSMTTGAIVLMALGNNAPSEGPFCLSSYYHLDPVEKAVASRAIQTPRRWNTIEIFYSGTNSGDLEKLARMANLSSAHDINCHFVISNGCDSVDGLIQHTEKWNRQFSAIPAADWYGSPRTIRICLIADGKNTFPTECQIRRVEALVEALYRKFNINPESIYYPGNWR